MRPLREQNAHLPRGTGTLVNEEDCFGGSTSAVQASNVNDMG